MVSLEQLAAGVLKLEDQVYQDPLRFAQFSPPQLKFLRCKDKFFLLRGGNQIGKTFVGAAELIWRCLGTHPYKKTPPPPIEAWVICHSYTQSLTVMGKIWELLPKAPLCDDVEFVTGKGFRGAGSPVVRFKNGSLIRFKTTGQTSGGRGTVALSSGTVGYVWIDEPPGPRVWSEVVARTLRVPGSCVGITMTPVGVPVDYLKKMCEEGIVTDIPAPLTVENTTVAGRPLLSQQAIDQMSRSYLKFDRSARMEGAWEGFAPDGVIFEEFRDELISDVPPPDGEWRMCVGIDHGHAAGSQCAVLVGVLLPDSKKPIGPNNDFFCMVLDEYQSGGADAAIHARAILAMIRRHGLDHNKIHRWTGDRSHGGGSTGDRKYSGRMSNTMLRSAFEHILGYPRGRGFRIHTAYKPAYSVYYGIRVIHDMMAKARFQIHPRCTGTIKSIKGWAMTRNNRLDKDADEKHLIDCLRYAIMPVVDVKYRAPKSSTIKLIR